ncbi:DUF647-domain-containing protein [Penicillium ucsense]|uniref:DUF647-domain-containing protein n=1 Tax=Penicillium ucsense TaxID=2839758 RepID=A0A8J8W306_9EURO|nr:DUF647-domain-containing protein [Penicillium ucsense]KAF7735223.1 DUF647-domain-containing protein [Penicillium ucsense]
MLSGIDCKNSRLIISDSHEPNHRFVAYIFPENDAGVSSGNAGGRVYMSRKRTPEWSLWSFRPLIIYLGDVFLPSGYPQSVSEDYLPSIAGLLSSRAVLQGVGVGNADASPTSALLLHILQDTSGRIATILFAHRASTALEPECKTYRLAADVFNDLAMILDCLSPMVPAGFMRVSVLSTAGVLRALCGVAGGSSKASLSAHFARWGNLAELNAKDSSQETVISLIGMLVGSVVVSHVTGFTSTWIALLCLLGLHLGMNYAAVRSVQMTSLNRQRANIVFSALFESDSKLNQSISKTRSLRDVSTGLDPAIKSSPSRHISESSNSPIFLTPAQAASQEYIFPRQGTLTWTSPFGAKQETCLGSADIGLSLEFFLKQAQRHASSLTTPTTNQSPSSFHTTVPMIQLAELYADEKYLLYLFPRTNRSPPSTQTWHASILLKKDCTVPDQLKAWAHALFAARVLNMDCEKSRLPGGDRAEKSTVSVSASSTSDLVMGCMADTLSVLNEGGRFGEYLGVMRANGWDVDIGALETRGGRRVECA